MANPLIYRKRLIPMECALLDKDEYLYVSENLIITRWNTIRPKKNLSHGISAYFLDKGIKVSKFYDHQHQLLSWYCDIITHEYQKESNTYIVTDLLADVLVFPDGSVKVVDLDELAEATEKKLLTEEQLLLSLHQLNDLLQLIYQGKFARLQKVLDDAEAGASA